MKINWNSIRNTTLRIFPYVVIFVLALLYFRSCQANKEYSDRVESNMKMLQDSTVTYRQLLKSADGKTKILTAENKLLQVTEEELRNQVWIKDKNITALTRSIDKLQAVIKANVVTEIPDATIVWKEPVPFKFARKDSVVKDFYRFDVSSNEMGVNVTGFKTWTDAYVVTGLKRKNIFSPYEATSSITFTNPDMQVKSMQGQSVTVEKTIWDSIWLWLGSGAILGFVLGNM